MCMGEAFFISIEANKSFVSPNWNSHFGSFEINNIIIDYCDFKLLLAGILQ